MLNLRKLKQDFSPAILKDGRTLYEKEQVLAAKIISINAEILRLSCKVQGNFDHHYDSEIEIDRQESTVIDSDCNCPYNYDCQHLAAILYYLEEHLDELIVSYSKETDIETSSQIDETEKKQLREAIRQAETKEVVRRGKKHQKELLQEYIEAAKILAKSPYFTPKEQIPEDKGELAVIMVPSTRRLLATSPIEIQLALRLPYRSKPLYIPNAREFLEAFHYGEQLYMGGKRYFFNQHSFDRESLEILTLVVDTARYPEPKEDVNPRAILLTAEVFGRLLAQAAETVLAQDPNSNPGDGELSTLVIPRLYCGSLENSLRLSKSPVKIRVGLEYIKEPAPKLLLNPTLVRDQDAIVKLEDVMLFECGRPGLIHNDTYFQFTPLIKRAHLRHLSSMRDVTIPEPLFGTFVENGISELAQFTEVTNCAPLERFVTLPFVGQLKAICDINYLNGELEASLQFLYDAISVPAAPQKLTADQVNAFVTPDGILARNLSEEQKILEDLFQDFLYDAKQGLYIAKADKKIVEFMTEVIPQNQHRVTFNCPENLLDRFVYDNSQFKLELKESNTVDGYVVNLKAEGHLKGLTLDLLWDCLSSKRAYIEIQKKQPLGKRKNSDGVTIAAQPPKVLVLDLDRLAPVVQIFDELGIKHLDNHSEVKPLWSLANVQADQFEGLPITFSISDKLLEIQQQILGLREIERSAIPKNIQATLPAYQVDGIAWLERLRKMHLNGILADDMGLGKTLQAIIALTQHKLKHSQALSIVICPTSLVYNWKEECNKFNPSLRVLPVDGTPAQRKKLLTGIHDYDLVVTSYSLLQKDIDFYQTIPFAYAILDEAQNIKNRATRNAKSVKMLQAHHRLILTGTPIENSLDELWSLFDFLMPGLLSSYDRFLEKYVRNTTPHNGTSPLEQLRRKVSPFILRRMKKDLLTDLPPVSEIVYHCHLSEAQKELYRSYANSAREELSRLVKSEGFEKVQIHVLATLTRLKQICCHPAIFAKEQAEPGDSAKYDMLLELLQSLIGSKHRTVVFSQYTRMLSIMRDDLSQQGIRFSYLDGSSKNRMSIVKEFNEDANIPVFLVSLKAGGSGLNLTGADTVIHYDMWWNPAVENQATDRVHRVGQTASVSAYKLVTLNTIEEKIVELQNRKRGLVQKVVNCDEEAMTKLTWEEVLELLQV